MDVASERPTDRKTSESVEARRERRKERRRNRKEGGSDERSKNRQGTGTGKLVSVSSRSLSDESRGSTTCSSVSSGLSDLRDAKGRPSDASTCSEGSSRSFSIPNPNPNPIMRNSKNQDKKACQRRVNERKDDRRSLTREEENMKDLMAILANTDGEIEIETKQGPGNSRVMRSSSINSLGSSDSGEDRSVSSKRRTSRRSLRGRPSARSGSDVSVGSACSRRSASSRRSTSKKRSSRSSRKTCDDLSPKEGHGLTVVGESSKPHNIGRSHSGRSSNRRSMMLRQSSVPSLSSCSDLATRVLTDSAGPETAIRGCGNFRRPSNITRANSSHGRRGAMQRQLSVPALTSRSDLTSRTQGLRMELVPSNSVANSSRRPNNGKRSNNNTGTNIAKQLPDASMSSNSAHVPADQRRLQYKQYQKPQKVDQSGRSRRSSGAPPRPTMLRRQASVPELSARALSESRLVAQQQANPMSSFLGNLLSPEKQKSSDMSTFNGSMPDLMCNLEQEMDDEILSMADEPLPPAQSSRGFTDSSTNQFNKFAPHAGPLCSRQPMQAATATSSAAVAIQNKSSRSLTKKEESFVAMLQKMEQSISNMSEMPVLEQSLRQLDQFALESTVGINGREMEDDSLPSLITNQSSPVSHAASSRTKTLTKEEQIFVSMLQQAEKSMSILPDTPLLERSLRKLPTGSLQKPSSGGTQPTEDSMLSDEGRSFASMPSLVSEMQSKSGCEENVGPGACPPTANAYGLPFTPHMT